MQFQLLTLEEEEDDENSDLELLGKEWVRGKRQGTKKELRYNYAKYNAYLIVHSKSEEREET